MRYCLDTNTAIYFLTGRLSEPLPDGERRVAEFIGQISIVDLTQEIKTLTITMRREKQLKLPDAIVAATAHAAQAILITNDSRLAHASGVRCVAPSLKA